MTELIDLSILAIFISTFFFVSITPGMCMMFAMAIGMANGLRQALWMMAGELVGVCLVALLSVAGVATIMLRHPAFFLLFKYIGGAYLLGLLHNVIAAICCPTLMSFKAKYRAIVTTMTLN